MTQRFYLLPVEVIGGKRGPKYLKWLFDPDPETAIDCTWGAMDYGLMDVMLIATDVDEAQHATLSGYADVIVVPANIDANITSQAVPLVQDALEGLGIPADWVDTTYTYRQILRGVAGLFQFAQMLHFLYGQRVIDVGRNLETRINQLPANVRLNLMEAATAMGWDTSGIAASWQLRRALMYLARQWGQTSFHIGGLDL